MNRIKMEVGEENDGSVHENEISVAEEFELKDVAKEKDTSIEDVELSEEAGLEKDFIKAVLFVIEEKDVSVHEAEISVASIPLQGSKEEVVFMSRKHKS